MHDLVCILGGTPWQELSSMNTRAKRQERWKPEKWLDQVLRVDNWNMEKAGKDYLLHRMLHFSGNESEEEEPVEWLEVL